MVSQPILRPRPILLLRPIKDNIGLLTIHYLYIIYIRWYCLSCSYCRRAPKLLHSLHCMPSPSVLKAQFVSLGMNSWILVQLRLFTCSKLGVPLGRCKVIRKANRGEYISLVRIIQWAIMRRWKRLINKDSAGLKLNFIMLCTSIVTQRMHSDMT